MTNYLENETSTLRPERKGGLFESLSPTDLASVLIYWTIGTTGVIGNGLVCIVFQVIRRKRSQVNLFIINQAIVDLITSMLLLTFGTTRIFVAIIPIEGVLGEFLCRFWWSRFFLFSCFAISTFNLIAMSIERYIAVKHPLSYSRIFKYRNVMIIISCVWLLAPIMQYIFPIWMYATANDACIVQTKWTFAAGYASGIILFFWEYFLPCIIMSTAYVTILVILNKKEKALNQAQEPHHSGMSNDDKAKRMRAHQRRRNITVTLVLLFIMYLLCWTPNQLTFLQFNMGGPLNFDGAWYHFTVVAAFLNTALNPFIYALKHEQFKPALKGIFNCRRVAPSDDARNVDPNMTVVD